MKKTLSVLCVFALLLLAPLVAADPAPLALPAPPAVMPDVGSGCPGLLPCSTLDVFAFTLRVDPWLAQGQEGQRGTAGGLRGALMFDMAERFSLGVSAAFAAWDPLGGGDRHLVWNLAGAHARVRLLPLRRPPEGEFAKWSLVATYDHLINPSDTRIGLVPAGSSTGTGQLALERGLGRVTLTISAGATYAPSGAAAALLGLGATFDTRQDDPLRGYLQVGGRLGVHGDAGSPSGWVAMGMEGITHVGGVGMGGGVVVEWGEVASALVALRVSQRLGAGNGGRDHIPHWWRDLYVARVAREERQHLAELAAKEALRQLQQQAAAQQLPQQAAPGGPYAGVLDQVGQLAPGRAPYERLLDSLGRLAPGDYYRALLDRLGRQLPLTSPSRSGPTCAGVRCWRACCGRRGRSGSARGCGCPRPGHRGGSAFCGVSSVGRKGRRLHGQQGRRCSARRPRRRRRPGRRRTG